MPTNRYPAQHLQRLIEVQSSVVQADLDLDGFMQLVVDTVGNLTAATGSVVELVDGDEMVYRCASANLAEHVGLRLRRSNSLSGRCVAEASVLRCDDSESDPRVDATACRIVGVRSMVCAPLFQRSVPVGVLKIMSDQPRHFDDGDVQSLTLLAGMLGAELGKQLAFDAVRQAEARLRILLEHAHDAVISINDQCQILRWNHAAERMFGCRSDGVIGRPLASLTTVNGASLAIDRVFEPTLAGQQIFRLMEPHECELIDGSGKPIAVEYTVSDHRFGSERELTAFITDITARHQMELALRELAQSDPLTSLANRRHFMNMLGKALARANRQQADLALYYLDMNAFKAINDCHGHDVGDQALQEFSRRLISCVRETDLVGRLGGDEFVLLAEGITNDLQATTLAGKIRQALDRPMRGQTFNLSASIGISRARPLQDAQDLLNEADSAMYEAKSRKGDNSVAVFYKGAPQQSIA